MKASTLKVRPVYAVVGESWLLRREAIERVLDVLAPHAGDDPPIRMDGAQAAPADVFDELLTPSLLGGKRVVLLDNADPFIRENRKRLENYCAAPGEAGFLVLIAAAMEKNTRLYKALDAAGALLPCHDPRPHEAVHWLTERARSQYGKGLPRNVAAIIVEKMGSALGAVDSELSKLAAYAAARDQISEDDLAAMSGIQREEKIFAVMDAVIAGDAATALQRWDQVLATDRAAPERAVGGIRWKIGFELSRVRPRGARTAVRRLEALRGALLDVDVAVKTGLSTLERAFEKFIVQSSAAAASG